MAVQRIQAGALGKLVLQGITAAYQVVGATGVNILPLRSKVTLA
jgi:hypothetical protein